MAGIGAGETLFHSFPFDGDGVGVGVGVAVAAPASPSAITCWGAETALGAVARAAPPHDGETRGRGEGELTDGLAHPRGVLSRHDSSRSWNVNSAFRGPVPPGVP